MAVLVEEPSFYSDESFSTIVVSRSDKADRADKHVGTWECAIASLIVSFTPQNL